MNIGVRVNYLLIYNFLHNISETRFLSIPLKSGILKYYGLSSYRFLAPTFIS